MLAGTHQSQFDLILNIFDMNRATGRFPTHQRRDDDFRKIGNNLTNASRCRTLPAAHRNECLGQSDCDFCRLETDNGSVSSNYLVIFVTILLLVNGNCIRLQFGSNRGRRNVGAYLHSVSLCIRVSPHGDTRIHCPETSWFFAIRCPRQRLNNHYILCLAPLNVLILVVTISLSRTFSFFVAL